MCSLQPISCSMRLRIIHPTISIGKSALLGCRSVGYSTRRRLSSMAAVRAISRFSVSCFFGVACLTSPLNRAPERFEQNGVGS